jgi:hypothetical protein
MPRHARARTEPGLVRDFLPVVVDSPIVTYRLEDYSDLFSLYLDVIESALHEATRPSRAIGDNWRRRDRLGLHAAND